MWLKCVRALQQLFGFTWIILLCVNEITLTLCSQFLAIGLMCLLHVVKTPISLLRVSYKSFIRFWFHQIHLYFKLACSESIFYAIIENIWRALPSHLPDNRMSSDSLACCQLTSKILLVLTTNLKGLGFTECCCVVLKFADGYLDFFLEFACTSQPNWSRGGKADTNW